MTVDEGQRKSTAQVIIVGAGPVGMLTALRLGQAGIDTLVIEGHDKLLNTTRACVYMPVVIPVLRELGMLDEVLKQAFLNKEGVAWRDIDGNELARLPLASSDPGEFGGVLLLGQWRMNAYVLEELKKYPCVQVRFGLKLESLVESPSTSFVTLTARNTLEPNSPDVHLSASYIIGTDGANSTTRRLLNLSFDGFTYEDLRMIGIDVVYDFIQHENFSPLNFVVHPTDCAVIAYTGQNEDGRAYDPTNHNDTPQWRVAYVEDPSLPNDKDSIWTRAEQQMHKYVRSNKSWKLLRAEPYTMSQRCASQPIRGRVALAGDALHSNNPIGGLGLTGGILDALCYGNALIRIIRGNEPDDLLTKCAQSRLDTWRNTTNKLSQANLQRLYGVDQETSQVREQMFALLNGKDKAVVAARMRQGMDAMMGDDFSAGVNSWIETK